MYLPQIHPQFIPQIAVGDFLLVFAHQRVRIDMHLSLEKMGTSPAQLSRIAAFVSGMKLLPSSLRIPALCACLSCACLLAQAPTHVPSVARSAQSGPPVDTDLNPVPLEWVPPAMLDLQTQAAVKESFTLDRAMLGAAADIMSDRDPRGETEH